MTETWLKHSDEIWLAASDLNKKGYKFSNISRESKQGGRIGLLYNKTFRIDFIQQKYRPETFEYGCWKLTVKSTSIHLHVINRAPDGNLNLFLDKFTEYATRIADQFNIILTWDFNVPIKIIKSNRQKF